MIKITYSHNGKTFVRVSKALARKAYDVGLDVVFCPCNLYPGEPYNPGIIVNKENSENKPFETVLNSFEFYNCNLPETGKYTSFYLPDQITVCFTFADGSNPYIILSEPPKDVIAQMKDWLQNYTFERVHAAGIQAFYLTENESEVIT